MGDRGKEGVRDGEGEGEGVLLNPRHTQLLELIRPAKGTLGVQLTQGKEETLQGEGGEGGKKGGGVGGVSEYFP